MFARWALTEKTKNKEETKMFNKLTGLSKGSMRKAPFRVR